MTLRELLGELMDHLDDEVQEFIIDVSFKEMVLDDGTNDSLANFDVTGRYLINHLLRCKQVAKQIEDNKPTDELVKS